MTNFSYFCLLKTFCQGAVKENSYFMSRHYGAMIFNITTIGQFSILLFAENLSNLVPLFEELGVFFKDLSPILQSSHHDFPTLKVANFFVLYEQIFKFSEKKLFLFIFVIKLRLVQTYGGYLSTIFNLVKSFAFVANCC